MMARQPFYARSYVAAILTLAVLCTGCRSVPLHRASASGLGEKLGTCAPSMVRGLFKEPTPGHPQLRALVVRLDTADPQQAKIGMEAGNHLREALNDYAKQELDLPDTGLRAADLQVVYVACVIANHDHAREIGMKANADVVFWGQIYCDWRNRAACEHYKIDMNMNRDNSVRDSPGSSVVNKVDVHMDAANNLDAVLKTSLTVVNWAGLEGDGLGNQSIHTGAELARADLPRLTSSKTKLLIDFVMGLFASKAERYGLAVRFFRRSQSGVEVTGIEGIRYLYQIMGQSYLYVGENELAMKVYNKALEQCDPVDQTCKAESMLFLGWALNYSGGDRAQARAYLEQAMFFHKKLGLVDREVLALHLLGDIYEHENNVLKAKEYYERALTLGKKINDYSAQASVLRELGDIAIHEDPDKAKKYYESALSICERLASESCSSTVFVKFGHLYMHKNEFDLAQSYLDKALAVAKREGIKDKLASIFRYMMDLSARKKNYDQLLRYGEQALITMKRLNAPGEQGYIHKYIGDILLRDRDCIQAQVHFKEALSLYIEAQHVSDAAKMLAHIGECLEKAPQPREAISYYKTAAEKYLATKPSDKKAAKDGLQAAYKLALRHGFLSLADEVLTVFASTQPSEIDLSLMRAMRLGYTRDEGASAAYKKITSLLPDSPEAERVRINSMVTAGVLRARQHAHWPDCPGVVVWQVKPDSVAAKLGLSVGDVLLRVENACLYGDGDLAALYKAPATKKQRLLRWHGESVDSLELPGGSDGFNVSPF